MMTANDQLPLDSLGDEDFYRLAELIEDYSGIRIPDGKRAMVESRLRRRSRDLGLDGLDGYCQYVFDEGGLDGELVHLIDAITTNKTEFFREPMHFETLTQVIVPNARKDDPGRELTIWSAACSIGAEPYTIAMVLDDYGQRVRSLRFGIIATDISTDVLKAAVEGVYDEEMVGPVPPDMRRRYLMRARDPDSRLVRVVPELRRTVRFGRLNLMDSAYPLSHDMDVIFCRNILIYFRRQVQRKVLERMCRHLRPGGYLILGHSETMAGMSLPLRQVGPTVFRNE